MTDHLEKIKLLNGLPDEVLNWLDKETEYKEVGKGDYLFHEGEEPARMYFVVSGGIKVVREFPSGKNSILGIFGPGQMVAEIAVVDQKPYPASAVAHEASLVGGVDAKIFRELLTRAPEAAIRLIVGLGGKLRELTGNMSAMAVQTVEKRLARFLLKLADRIGEPVETGIMIFMPMTRRDLAEIIGASFEVIERSLKKMREAGILAVDGKEIVILSKDNLSALLDE